MFASSNDMNEEVSVCIVKLICTGNQKYDTTDSIGSIICAYFVG